VLVGPKQLVTSRPLLLLLAAVPKAKLQGLTGMVLLEAGHPQPLNGRAPCALWRFHNCTRLKHSTLLPILQSTPFLCRRQALSTVYVLSQHFSMQYHALLVFVVAGESTQLQAYQSAQLQSVTSLHLQV